MSSEQQQFCLRWNNYQNNIISSFEFLRSEEDFVDVTLACEGRSLKAHKVILSACSPYFRDLLKTTPCQHPIIVLKDVCYEDLLSLMCFVYQGVVYIGQDRLTQFLRTAEFLQIKGLSEHNVRETASTPLPSVASSVSASTKIAGTGVDSSSSPTLPNFLPSLPALTPINNATAAVAAAAAMAAAAAANRCSSPQLRSSRSTPSPSTSLREACAGNVNGTGSAKKRKSLYPIHAYMPAQTSSISPGQTADDSPPAPTQSSPVEEAPASDTTIATEGLNSIIKCEPVSVNVKSSNNGGQDCQEEALSLVTETSILRQRIEGCSTPTDSVCDNGALSPVGTVGSVSSEPIWNQATPLMIEPSALSMVGRETVGYPFFSQPGTSSLLSTTVSTVQDGQQMAMNQANSTSPRYRQRWRCMQPSVCPHCLRTFSNAFNLKQHIINVHTFGNELKCEVCGKVQKNKWYLRKHMVKSHNAPLRRVKLPDGTMVNTE